MNRVLLLLCLLLNRLAVIARLNNAETISTIRTAAPSDNAVAELAVEIQTLNPQVKDVSSQ